MGLTSFADVSPYAEVTYADAYFASKLAQVDSWGTLTPAQKLAALRQATLEIDTLNFVGYRSSLTQVREWPRNLETDSLGDIFLGTDILPAVAQACCEQAFYIAQNFRSGYDPGARRDHQDQGAVSINRTGASESYDISKARRHKLCPSAYELIRSFVSKGGDFIDPLEVPVPL